MNDKDLLLQAIEYHRYLMRNRAANPKHPLYARAITGNVFMSHTDEKCDTQQLHRVTRYMNRWLKTLISCSIDCSTYPCYSVLS